MNTNKGYKQIAIFGPPGTGKTTHASNWIQVAAEKYGPENVFVTSFTKAAAQNIAGRELNGVRAGTLHSHCYNGLDRPKIAESFINSAKDNDGITPWNQVHPDLNLTAAKGLDIDNDPFLPEMAGEGDYFMAEAQRLRARMIPPENWQEAPVQDFYRLWTDWKQQHGLLDFTDLIETAIEEMPYAPGNPAIGFVDEAQDMTPLQMKLIRSWACFMTHVVSYGDDDQILYAWAGCTPETMMQPVPDEIRVLSQSYRIPRKVHVLAERWIQLVKLRQPKEYRPRQGEDADGNVFRSSATWRSPYAIVNDARERIERGQTCMFLASCGYMLRPLLEFLREEGIPFHNPYRCSPHDEPILTTEGYVPISELDPQRHKLAGFYATTNSLSWGGASGPPRAGRERGFGFSVASRPYSGTLLTIMTAHTRTRVTPNHRIRVRYNDAFYDKWIVYLMRRGNHWRVGITSTGSKPFMSDGIGGRVSFEDADGAWILSVHESKQEAMLAEAEVQARYGITGMTFIAWPHARRHLTQTRLDQFHRSLADCSSFAAQQLLEDRGLLREYPLFIGDGKRRRRTGVAFETVAANVIPGYMDMPVAPASFTQTTDCPRIVPEWLPLSVTRGHYDGPVYSMDVPGPEHYISGGAIVHNSKQPNWNPLHASRGHTPSEKLLLFLRNEESAWGQDARMWTHKELSTVVETIEAKGVLQHGAKAAIKELAKTEKGIVTWDQMSGWFTEDGLNALFNADPNWYADHALKQFSKSLAFPMRVMSRLGSNALHEAPKIIVGTIHSVKGGEADCVYLFPDLSEAGYYNNWEGERDSVIRLGYVGLTRARDTVVLCSPVSDLAWHGML